MADPVEELLAVMGDAQLYAETFLSIRDKAKRLVPFRANAQQRRLWQIKRILRRRGQGVRLLVLKARQMGVTTQEQLDSYHMVARRDGGGDGVNVLTLAHDTDTTEMIFQIALRCWLHQDEEFRPRKKTDNKRELYFPDLDSWFGIRTAGAAAVGHGLTLRKVHGSEVAYWRNAPDVQTGLNEAVPLDGEMVFESTPNGAAGVFYELCQQAKEANGIVTLHDPVDLERQLAQVGRGGRTQWVLSFFPWFEFPEYQIPLQEPDELGALTEREEALVEAYGLMPEQLKFRRRKIADYRGMEELFDQEYPSDPVSCFLLSGRRIFDAAALKAAFGRCRPPERVVELRKHRGVLKIWREFEEGHSYIIGVDTSEGVQGGDYGVCDVYDAATWEQVATFHGLPKPHGLAEVAAALGRGSPDLGFRGYANPRSGPALLVVEANNTGHAVLSTLLHELAYPRAAIYHRTHYADPMAEPEERPGWVTDSATKWIMLDDLGTAISERTIRFNDADTVQELLAYQLGEDGKPGAPTGTHDDRVIAAAVAFQGRKYRVVTGAWRTTGGTDSHPARGKEW